MSDIDDAIAALARAEGKSAEEMRQEVLKAGVKAKLRGESSEPIARRRVDRPLEGEFDEGPRRSRRDETPEEAKERWYREEEEDIEGVHGWAGQSAGGIFGNGPIATESYDPAAHHRGAAHTAAVAQAQQARAMTGLVDVVGRLAEQIGLRAPELEGRPRRRLRGR
jgi:hypothetical protein